MGLTYEGIGESVEHTEGQRRRVVGSGREAFERASDAVLRWEVKRRAGFRVAADEVVLGDDVRITFGPLVEQVRVVRVVDEPRCRGFAYGTLERHPLRGEEAFLVEHRADDAVELVIRAFSRPNGIGWTLLWPAVAVVRQVMLRRYLRALVD